MPASRLMVGFRIPYSHFGQIFAINTAVNMPIGTPNIIAPAVTYKLPIIIGKMPNDGGTSLGDQSMPSKKSIKPISAIVGIPPANRNTHISPTATMAARADSVNTHCIIRSL